MHGYPEHVTPNGTIDCVAPNCSRRTDDDLDDQALAVVGPRPAVQGSDLCSWHERQFSRVVGDLGRALPDVRRAVLKSKQPGRGGRVQSSTVSDVGALWNPAASRLATDLVDWAGFLVRTVLKERPTSPQHPTHGVDERLDAAAALSAIARWHSSWLARYPDLGPSLLAEALEYRRRVENALNTDGVTRIQLDARCQHVVDETPYGPVLCEAQLVGVLRRPGEREPSRIVCTAHPDHPQVHRSQWMRLAPRGAADDT